MLLEVKDLEVAYGDYQVVWGVSLTVAAGESVALLGPNGSGKSTVVNAITGLIRSKAGDIRFEDKSLVGQPTHSRAALGIAHVLERRRVFPHLTVQQNLMLGAWHPAARAARAKTTERVFALFPAHGRAQEPARTHPLGRRAADAGARPRPHVPAQVADGRRAVPGPRPAGHRADAGRVREAEIRGHGHPVHRAERAPRPVHGEPRLHPGKRPTGRRRTGQEPASTAPRCGASSSAPEPPPPDMAALQRAPCGPRGPWAQIRPTKRGTTHERERPGRPAGGRHRRHVYRHRPARRRAALRQQGADHATRARVGGDRRHPQRAGRRGPGIRRHRPVRARHHARHQRHHRAQGRQDGADRYRRLPRRDRDRRREPLRPVRHQHRQDAAPGAARAALHGAGAPRRARRRPPGRSTSRPCARWPSASPTPASRRSPWR